MRLQSDEFAPAKVGLTGDPMILHHMTQASKDSPIKKGSRILIGLLLVLALLGGLMALYAVFFPRQVDFDRVEKSFVEDMVNRQLPKRMHISQMAACYLDETYYYAVDFRVGEEPDMEQHVFYGFSGVEGWFDLANAPQGLRSEYDRARIEGEQKVYTQTEIDDLLAPIYEYHEKKGHLE